MSEETRALIVAGITGPFAIGVDRTITWLRNRRKDDAEAGLTVDQRWKQYADRIEARMKSLEERVDELEKDLEREQNRAKGLEAEVDHYRRIARSVLRHMLKLRDALSKAHAEVPEIPPDIEEALIGIDLT
jgi:chromosome segregation ATPase